MKFINAIENSVYLVVGLATITFIMISIMMLITSLGTWYYGYVGILMLAFLVEAQKDSSADNKVTSVEPD